MERFGLTTCTFGKLERYKLEILRLSTLTEDGSSIANFGGISTNYSEELPETKTVAPSLCNCKKHTEGTTIVVSAQESDPTSTFRQLLR
jgi:hypothetical protein